MKGEVGIVGNICVLCHYARMRTDICATYCVGSFFKKPDGSCDHFLSHEQVKKEKRANRKQLECDTNESICN